ncbi:hypothetical protein D3C81_1232370 [compost metagenome]
MPTTPPMVTMPVPPMPATTMRCGLPASGSAGIGIAGGVALPPAGFAGCFSWPPSTVTKLGQKPLVQEKSLLQVSWLTLRLRPKSVSTGCTARQLLCTEQSPQPSHTSSLMTTRRAGSAMVPRLRSRRFLVAQAWS